jgi:hypothetical protein
MSAIAANLSDAERVERAAFLKRLGLAPKGSATILDHPAKRRPLGLGIVPDDNDPPASDGADNMTEDGRVILHDGYSFSFKDGIDPAFLAAPAFNDFVVEMANAVTSIADSVLRKANGTVAGVRSEARADVGRIELENARLKASVAELTAKVDTLTFISERLRIENAGPVGPQGPMGRDGHEGRPGARGERGERGEPGKAAPAITAWTLDTDNFTAVPILSNGELGATLRLRPLYEAFPDALNDADAAEEADTARASREAVEREAEATRQGR